MTVATTAGLASRPILLPAFGDRPPSAGRRRPRGPSRRRSRRGRRRRRARCRYRRAPRAPWRISARGVGRAAILVDVEAVRLDADRDHLGARVPTARAGATLDRRRRWRNRSRRAGRRATGRAAACAWRIRCSGPARRRCAWRGRCSADLASRLRQVAVDQRFDLASRSSSRELVAVRPEQLDAVVVEGLCEAEIITPRSARIERVSMATPGVGIGPSEQHVHADRGEARDQRVLDHVAREARILADHHAVAVVAALEDEARRLPHLEGKLRRDQRHWRGRECRRCRNTCESSILCDGRPYRPDSGALILSARWRGRIITAGTPPQCLLKIVRDINGAPPDGDCPDPGPARTMPARQNAFL